MHSNGFAMHLIACAPPRSPPRRPRGRAPPRAASLFFQRGGLNGERDGASRLGVRGEAALTSQNVSNPRENNGKILQRRRKAFRKALEMKENSLQKTLAPRARLLELLGHEGDHRGAHLIPLQLRVREVPHQLEALEVLRRQPRL